LKKHLTDKDTAFFPKNAAPGTENGNTTVAHRHSQGNNFLYQQLF